MDPLRSDIRLLGGLLGTTIREQRGEATFALVERIRRTSLRFRREQEREARLELETLLGDLDPASSLSAVHAFTVFAQLSNIAEDLDQNRRERQRALAGGPGRADGLECTLARRRDARDLGRRDRGAPRPCPHRPGVFPRLDAEFRRTRQAVLAITDQRELLDANPALARGIRERLPYLDPLNHLQLDLLRRHRGGETDGRIRHAIHLTINGIASGLRNSG